MRHTVAMVNLDMVGRTKTAEDELSDRSGDAILAGRRRLEADLAAHGDDRRDAALGETGDIRPGLLAGGDRLLQVHHHVGIVGALLAAVHEAVNAVPDRALRLHPGLVRHAPDILFQFGEAGSGDL